VLEPPLPIAANAVVIALKTNTTPNTTIKLFFNVIHLLSWISIFCFYGFDGEHQEKLHLYQEINYISQIEDTSLAAFKNLTSFRHRTPSLQG
jgi:hypothetical protein